MTCQRSVRANQVIGSEIQSSVIPLLVPGQGGLIEQVWALKIRNILVSNLVLPLTSCITQGDQPSSFTFRLKAGDPEC